MTDLKQLYDQIPTFKCKQGCTECCGPVPFAECEWDVVVNKRYIEAPNLMCPYAVDGRCEIYDQRPLLCRLFGATHEPRLQCPYGCKPLNPLSIDITRTIMKEYSDLFHE